jgi:hypothetical protein
MFGRHAAALHGVFLGRSLAYTVVDAATPTPTVTAQLANDCLLSVPNKPEPAQKLITSLKSFVAWQSTLVYLKSPPPSYGFPAVDIMAGLDNISSTAGAGRYTSEYEFQLDIVRMLASAHDGHFAYRPDVFKAFGFRNNLVKDLVSISTDGKELPKLYHLCQYSADRSFCTTCIHSC